MFDNSVMIEVVEAVLDALNKTNEEIISQSEMTKKVFLLCCPRGLIYNYYYIFLYV